MVVHGAVQHTRNLQKLASLPSEAAVWTDPGAARADVAALHCEYDHRRCDEHDHADGAFEPRGACSAEAAVDLARLEEALCREGLRETPRFGRDQSARGMGMSTVSLLKVTREGRFERPVCEEDERRL